MKKMIKVLFATVFFFGLLAVNPVHLVAESEGSDQSVNKIDTITIQAQMQYGQTEARRMLSMINDFRTGDEAWAWNSDNTKKVSYPNLSRLSYDYELEKVAMQRAAEIAISFSHTRVDGSSCFTLYDETSGENIAAGQTSAEEVFESWKETDKNYSGQGHRRNMLGGHASVGIGHVYFNGMHYWVQEFGYSLSKTAQTQANDSLTEVKVRASLASCEISGTADTESLSLTTDESRDLPSVDFFVTTEDSCGYYTDPVSILEAGWAVENSACASVSEGRLYGISPGTTDLILSVGDRNILTIPVTITDGNCSHRFENGETTRRPTCTTSGQIRYICTECGYTYYDNISPSGHRWDEGALSADGYEMTFHCKECGIDYSSEDVHKEATVYMDGSYSYSTAFKLLRELNSKRKATGLSTMIMDRDLLALCMEHASNLTVLHSITQNPDGTPFKVARGCGILATYSREYQNLITGICNNLKDYTDCCSIGIGVFIQNDMYYLCVVFNTLQDNYKTEATAASYKDKTLTIEIPVQGNVVDFSLESYNKSTGEGEYIYSLNPGEKKYLRVKVWPVAVINPRSYTGWKSSDPSVITVNSSGCITAIKDGSAVIYCRLGDYVIQKNIEVYDDNLHLGDLSFSKKSYSYTGNQVRPSVTAYNENGKKIPANCYTVKYGKNINVGKGKVTVTGKGKYKGTISSSFKILPKGTRLLKVKGKKRSLVIRWKKQPKQIDGYEIQYHIGKKFAQTNKIIRIKNPATTKKVIKKLKKKIWYCVRIRTYKKLKTTTYYSEWSKTIPRQVK